VAFRPEIRTIGQILPVNLRENPGKTALQFYEDGRLKDVTYAHLSAAVQWFAGELRTCGVHAHDRAVLLMPNSVGWIIAFFGIHAVGAAAVPLEYESFELEPDRTRYTIEHSQATLVVCRPEDRDKVANLCRGLRVRLLSADCRGPAMEDGQPSPSLDEPDIRPGAIAQILYTSGTTGPKKGVVLTHRNLIFNVRTCCEAMKVYEHDRLPALLPFHHAYPLTATIILPLLAGATLVVGDARSRQTRDLLPACRPTVLVGVPRLFESLLDSVRSTAWRSGREAKLQRAASLSARIKKWTGLNVGKLLFRSLHRQLFGGGQLRFCVSGGARLSPQLQREYMKLGILIMQGWGMTELSPVGTMQRFSRFRFYFTRYYERAAGSIGRPLDGTEVLLEGEGDASDLPGGMPAECGEMIVSGPHVMEGYLRDPDETRKWKTARGLKTGDMAWRNRDGDLFIMGRTKHVIVLPNGKKVFPELDLHDGLKACPGIDEFLVKAIPDGEGGERIGIIVRPDMDFVHGSGISTWDKLYETLRRQILSALEGKPAYLKNFDFCLTEYDGEAFAELVKSMMKEPTAKNRFVAERSYTRNKGRPEAIETRP